MPDPTKFDPARLVVLDRIARQRRATASGLADHIADMRDDLSPAARQRRAQIVDARLAADPATGSARASLRRKIEAEIEAEEIADSKAAAARAEAAAERARIAAVVAAGKDVGKARSALRLALAGPVTALQATDILATLPADASAKLASRRRSREPIHRRDRHPGPAGRRPSRRCVCRGTSGGAILMAGDAVSITVAARLLGISPDRLRQLVRAGHVVSPARGRVSLVSAMRGYASTLRSSAVAPSSAALARSQRIKAEITAAETAARKADLIEMERATSTVEAIANLAVDHVRDMARPAALRGFPPDPAGRIRDEAAEVITKIQTASAAAQAALTSGEYGEIAE